MNTFRLTVASALFVVATAACGRTPVGPTGPQGNIRLGDLTLSGRILDASSPGSGVGGVNVTAANGGVVLKATSEPDGNFVIDGLMAGEWQVWFSLPGYIEQYQLIQLESSQSITSELVRDESADPLPDRKTGKRSAK